MPDTNDETQPAPAKFDFSAYPPDSLFHERRSGLDRRAPAAHAPESPPIRADGAAPARAPRVRKDRRRRIDPTTFEKQYTDDELEFMNAVQDFKIRSGKSFPSHGDVLRVAASLGYRKVYFEEEALDEVEVGSGDEPSREVTLPVVPA